MERNRSPYDAESIPVFRIGTLSTLMNQASQSATREFDTPPAARKKRSTAQANLARDLITGTFLNAIALTRQNRYGQVLVCGDTWATQYSDTEQLSGDEGKGQRSRFLEEIREKATDIVLQTVQTDTPLKRYTRSELEAIYEEQMPLDRSVEKWFRTNVTKMNIVYSYAPFQQDPAISFELLPL